MKKFLSISTFLLFVLSALSALLWVGGIAGAVTGGGQNTSEIDYVLTLSKVFIALAGLCGVTAWAWPGKISNSADEINK